MTTNTELNTG